MHTYFLLGAYGQNNLGDDALLEVFLKQLSDARLIVNSAQPAETQRRYGVEAVATYSSWPRLRRPRALWRSNAIVFGGGSLLKEIEGSVLARLLYFFRIFLILLFGKLFGRPTAMLGVGIGPLDRPLYRWLSRHAANLTDLICVRDADSRDLLHAIGVRRPIHVTADPVFTLDSERPASNATPSLETERPTLVVVPRYSLSESQVAALAAACDHMVEAHGARVCFVVFQTGYRARFDDAATARAVQAHMRHADQAELRIPETSGAALELIGQANMLLSSRLHGLIFATLRGVATIALDYEIKVRSFMREIGQEEASVSLDELADGKLPSVLDTVWAKRHERGADARTQMQALRARSLENFVHFRELIARPRPASALTGGALLFASMTIVNAGNYLFNLVLGRWLGPAAFADLSLVITILLVITMITSTLQIISAKFAAMHAANGDEAQIRAVRAWLGRGAWALGAAMLLVFIGGSQLWQSFFQTTSAWPFVILGLGMPLYFVQGVDRGVLQGQTRFGPLALSYQAEMWARLLGAVALVALGFAVNGAVAGVTISLVATWLVGFWFLRPRQAGERHTQPLAQADRRAILSFAGPVVAALVGQVMINNSDILIVKHFFPAEEAGHYAALALIGRIVFFATLSVVAAMFPLVAQKQQRGEPHRHLLWMALGLVALASLAVIAAALVVPGLMVRVLFGEAYLAIAPLLWLYAVATMLYALANVVINYRLSAGDGGGSALAMLAGTAQVAGLWLFHSSLREVVIVQIVLMVGLFVLLLAWDWRLARRARSATSTSTVPLAPVHRSLRRRLRGLLLGIFTLSLLLLMWQVAGAQAPVGGAIAQQQVQQLIPSLRDSEAEHASGAYFPGVGAMITLDLVRGPNAFPDKPAKPGVHDWMVYLLGSFGPRLTAVPPDEKIAFSVDYYDYEERNYHQIVVSSRAADIADSGKYIAWFDGQPYEQASAAAAAQVPASAPVAQGGLTLDFADAQASTADWAPQAGEWAATDGGYAQTQLGRYDLINMLNRTVEGNYRFQADLKYLEGEMGGGIVFNAPDASSKNGAQMISYSEKGNYLQWGLFDDQGVYQFKGGSPVANGADGQWHTLAVTVTGANYRVELDGTTLATDVPLASSSGYVGLFASTSRVLFDNVKLESVQP